MILLAILLAVGQLAHCLDPVPAIHAQNSTACSSSTYDSCEYMCYDSSSGPLLCPIVHGIPFELCDQECYTSYQYSCNHTTNNITELPIYRGPVTLTALNPTAPFHGLPLNAAGTHMYLSEGNGAYCPSSIVKDCPPGNTTVMVGASLSVEVPGGQQMYIQTDGAWTYTQAHSIGVYNVSVYGAGVPYADAGYFGPNGTTWIACPQQQQQQQQTQQGGSGGGSDPSRPWQVFADLPGVTYADECEGFFAAVQDLPLGTIGAWEY